MELVTCVRFILLFYIGIEHVIQVGGLARCNAFSFDSSGNVARCHSTKQCPSLTDICRNMNHHGSYGTCCLSCGSSQVSPSSSRTCSSDIDCPQSPTVIYHCKKPINKPDAIGLCCGRTRRQY